MADTSSRSRSGSGCLILFGAVFAVAGLLIGGFAVNAVWHTYQARHWTAVEAKVLDTGLERGDDTWRVTARYRYTVDGVDYESERVSFHSGSDNIGDFHQATHDHLRRLMQTGTPATAYVNPAAPADAVLVRDVRWGLFGFMMLFPLVFGGAGAGIIAFALVGKRRLVKTSQRERLYPDEPWRWRPEWENGVIAADTRKTLWSAGFFATLWNLISLPLPFLLWDEVLDKGNYAALLGLLFPVVGIGLIAWVVRLALQQRRFGRIEFTLDTFPGALGGQLVGKLFIPAQLPVDRLLHATLTCVRQRTTGAGKNRSTREDFLWQDEQRLRIQQHHVFQGTRLHMAFPLPADRPPTDDSDPANQIIWRLTVSSEMPGIDLGASFEVPVFDVGAAATKPAEPVTSGAAEAPDWRRTGVIARETPRGLELFVPPARHKGMAFMLTVVATIFSSATWFLANASEILLAVVFGGFSLLLVWAALHSWLHRSRLLLTPGSLWVQRGHAWWSRPRRLLAHTVRRIDLKTTTRIGSTQYYDLAAVTRDDKSLKLAGTLPGRRDTEALAELIAARAGIEQGD